MSVAVLLVTGTLGDVTPFRRIGAALLARGVEVSVVSHYPFRELFTSLGAKFFAIDSKREYASFVHDLILLNKPNTVGTFYQRHILPRAYAETKLILGMARRRELTLFANDTPGISARFAASALGVRSYSVLTYPDHIRVQHLMGRLFSQILWPHCEDLARLTGVASAREDWWATSEVPALACWPKWFWPATRTGGLHYLGFVTDPNELPADSQFRSRLVITGGSSTLAARDFFGQAVAAAKLLGQPTLLLSKSSRASEVPLPPNVTLLPWVPSLSQTLAGAKTVVHHGGMGTIGVALNSSCPQVVLAAGGDRPFNGRLVEEQGLGKSLRPAEWNVKRIGEAIKNCSSQLIADAIRKRKQDRNTFFGDRQERELWALVRDAFPKCVSR